MTAKEFLFEDEARDALRRGVNELTRTVSITLGPKGKNVVIEKKHGNPIVTKDGVTVAKNFELKDKFENMGATLLRGVANDVADKAGDGTTTATVVAKALFDAGLKLVVGGVNPTEIKIGVEKAAEAVIKEIEDNFSKPVKSRQDFEQVATISANGDVEIGKIISQAMEKVGKEGVITVEKGNGRMNTEIRVAEGMEFDRGYLSSYFATNVESLEAEYSDAHILLCDSKISSMKSLLPLLQKISELGKPLLIIAEDVETEVLATLVLNKMRGGLKVCAVKAPGFGDRRKAMLEDIAIICGAEVVSEELGMKLEDVTVDQLGTVESLVVGKDFTTLAGGKGKKENIEARANFIRNQIENSDSKYDKEQLNNRLAKIISGVVIIYVGGTTEVEVEEKEFRVVDAVAATQAAARKGKCPGGGITLLLAGARAISKVLPSLTGEQKMGAEALQKALEAPLYYIAGNAGEDSSVIIRDVLNKNKDKVSDYIGYDATTGKFENMEQVGIIDPTEVLTSVVYASRSIGLTLLGMGALVADAESNNENAASPMAAAGMPGMGMGGY